MSDLSVGTYSDVYFTAEGKMGYDEKNSAQKECVFVHFTCTQDGIMSYVNAIFDKDSGDYIMLSKMDDKHLLAGDPIPAYEEVAQSDIDAEIANVAKELGLGELTWYTDRERKIFTNWGSCIPVRAVNADKELVTVYIACDDAKVHGIDFHTGTLVEALP